ncbi:MAG TPA: bile acid:sodium symporter family protein [Verrucomicrobia bacterium]|nr:bile acid:sodium symporter family protein [Verrucomicrobiota bacterium]HPU56524.1 bile acid:sodium symporter family protein [Verrucomicrobiota bacterium]
MSDHALMAAIGGMDTAGIGRLLAVLAAIALAIGLRFAKLRGYQFTAWIIVAVVSGMLYPERVLKVGEFDMRNKWLILFVVQAVMFGMGTQMKLKDFVGVVRMPWAVFVGVLGQFTIMPLTGYALTKIFHFEPEIAAGVILIGSCSAGLASNVMAYLAGANLALSITMTSVTTMLAPLMTPLWMKWLAGELVEVNVFGMMMEIIKIVIVPIGAALLHDYLSFASRRGRMVVYATAVAAAAWLVFLAKGGWPQVAARGSSDVLPWIGVGGFLLGAVLVGLLYHLLTGVIPRLSAWTPVLSMAGIVYFTTVTTAAGRDHLLRVGVLLFLAAVLHNAAGYLFGYWLARAGGLDRNSARTVAFEVGLQNGGMASGIAGSLGKLGTMGLASAIFSPWMNVSGSVLANYWRRKPVTGSVKTRRADQQRN